MRYEYSTKMHLSFKSALKRHIKIIYHSIFDIFEDSIETITQPVFIVGCGNSGTTLTATILSRHPDAFSIGFESNFFFPTLGLNYSKKIAIFIDTLSRQYKKSFFMEKTPKHALCIGRIFKILPHAKIIYVIRDGRDAVASLKKRYKNIEVATDRWVTDNRSAIKWKFDDRVKLIRYEDLVKNPHQTVTLICEHLNITFDPKMLTSSETPYKNTAKGNMIMRSAQVSAPIYNNTGKWESNLTPEELSYFMAKASHIMRKLDYAT